jgi:hypothetical protein
MDDGKRTVEPGLVNVLDRKKLDFVRGSDARRVKFDIYTQLA